MSVVHCTTNNMCKLICNSKRLTQVRMFKKHIHDCVYCVLVATMNVHIHIYKNLFQIFKTMPNKLATCII